MNFEKLLYWILVLISVTTLVSGLVQVFAPAFILGLVGAEITPATKQCFGTVGMFMFLFGGMLLQVLLSRQMVAPVFLWAGLQKVGAFVAVGIGVMAHVFSLTAMLVACFDLLSGILIFTYMKLAATPNTASLPAAQRTVS
jgi:hypothetical protein